MKELTKPQRDTYERKIKSLKKALETYKNAYTNSQQSMERLNATSEFTILNLQSHLELFAKQESEAKYYTRTLELRLDELQKKLEMAHGFIRELLKEEDDERRKLGVRGDVSEQGKREGQTLRVQGEGGKTRGTPQTQ